MRMSNGRNQTSAFRDFGMYGTYAADMRYRQERIDGETSHPSPIIPYQVREWLGTALIRLGTRIDGGGRMRADRRTEPQPMASTSMLPRT